MHSCRSVLDTLNLEAGENASLLMARYIKNLDDNNASKKELLSAIPQAASEARELYSQAFAIRRSVLARTAAPGYFRTIQPLAVGLGNKNVIETGLAMNPLYGMPMLPASSIKGITAHYCSEVFGSEDPRFKDPDGEIYEALFGAISPEGEQNAGLLSFYDAWIMPECASKAFIVDVMTPHHGSDFADPVPINFLTVNGDFELWIGCRNFEADRKWIDFAFGLTEAALRNYGIGGKIRAGYGKMERILSPEEIRERAKEKERAENAKSGFLHAEGDIVEVVCKKVKIFKGKEKREFAFTEDSGDRNAVRFDPVPKVNEGEKLKAEVKRIERSNKAYILQAL